MTIFLFIVILALAAYNGHLSGRNKHLTAVNSDLSCDLSAERAEVNRLAIRKKLRKTPSPRRRKK